MSYAWKVILFAFAVLGLASVLNAQGIPSKDTLPPTQAEIDSIRKVMAQRAETVYVFTFPLEAVAITRCVDNKVYSWIDMSYLSADNINEIVAHEAKHREQYANVGNCEEWEKKWTFLPYAIDQEAEAYCVSLEVAKKEGKDVRQKWSEYISRLMMQFGQGNVSLATKALNAHCSIVGE